MNELLDIEFDIIVDGEAPVPLKTWRVDTIEDLDAIFAAAAAEAAL